MQLSITLITVKSRTQINFIFCRLFSQKMALASDVGPTSVTRWSDVEGRRISQKFFPDLAALGDAKTGARFAPGLARRLRRHAAGQAYVVGASRGLRSTPRAACEALGLPDRPTRSVCGRASWRSIVLRPWRASADPNPAAQFFCRRSSGSAKSTTHARCKPAPKPSPNRTRTKMKRKHTRGAAARRLPPLGWGGGPAGVLLCFCARAVRAWLRCLGARCACVVLSGVLVRSVFRAVGRLVGSRPSRPRALALGGWPSLSRVRACRLRLWRALVRWRVCVRGCVCSCGSACSWRCVSGGWCSWASGLFFSRMNETPVQFFALIRAGS